MKNKVYMVLSAIIMCLLTGHVAFAQELCEDDTIEVMNGEYKIANNIWGEGAGEPRLITRTSTVCGPVNSRCSGLVVMRIVPGVLCQAGVSGSPSKFIR